MDVETGVKSAVETGVESSVETGVKNEGKKKGARLCDRGGAEKKKERGKKRALFFQLRFSNRFPAGFPHPGLHQFPRVFSNPRKPRGRHYTISHKPAMMIPGSPGLMIALICGP